MVRVGKLAAAIVLAAAMGGAGAATENPADARAQEWFWSFPAPPEPRTKSEDRGPKWFWSLGAPKSREAAKSREKERERIRLLMFSGVDLWRHSAFAHDGLQWMPAGADADGFILKAIVSTGSYRYRAGALGNAEVTGWMTGAAVMPGVHFTRHGVTVTALVGLDLQTHALSPFDPGGKLNGRYAGARIAVDLWAEPTPQTMLAASASLSTIGGAYAARLAAGWRLFDRLYLGPEAIVFGGPEYRQLRFGLHVTGLRTELFDWRFEWQGGVGFAFDDDDNSGAYARLGILWRH
jgi:hypothetical protein